MPGFPLCGRFVLHLNISQIENNTFLQIHPNSTKTLIKQVLLVRSVIIGRVQSPVIKIQLKQYIDCFHFRNATVEWTHCYKKNAKQYSNMWKHFNLKSKYCVWAIRVCVIMYVCLDNNGVQLWLYSGQILKKAVINSKFTITGCWAGYTMPIPPYIITS